MSADLSTCSFVFVRNDAVKQPLQKPYDGLFCILQRTSKHFTLDVLGQKKVVSLDRLKPTFVEDTLPVPNPLVIVQPYHLREILHF